MVVVLGKTIVDSISERKHGANPPDVSVFHEENREEGNGGIKKVPDVIEVSEIVISVLTTSV